MIYYVDQKAGRGGNGSKERPFQYLSEAAEIAQPGDEVLAAPGIYREYVNPQRGGTPEKPIVYRSVQPLGAVITGAEQVKNWVHYEGSVWMVKISNGLFGAYNPYKTIIAGDWYRALDDYHTGEVYLNGKSLYEAPSLDMVLHPETDRRSWDPDFTFTSGLPGRMETIRLFTQTSREQIPIRRMWRSMCAGTAFIRIRQGQAILR